MARIHEILPVENDKVEAANALVAEAVATFSKRPDHFNGHVRTVTMYDEQRQGENTSEVKEVGETVNGKLDHVWAAFGRALDVTMAKEKSNTSPEAVADVVVDGTVVLSQLPATALLALEKRLGLIADMYQAIPTLDPAYTWEPDASAALENTMRTKYPQEGQKTEKQSDVLVLYPATDKHPAQVKEVTLDKNVAKVTVNRQSGMVSPATKAEWLGRIEALRTAVKEARQRANMATVLDLPVAQAIENYIHSA